MYYKIKLQQIREKKSDKDFLLKDGECFELIEKTEVSGELSGGIIISPCSLSEGLATYEVSLPLGVSDDELLEKFNEVIAINNLEMEEVNQVGGCHYKCKYQVIDYVMKHSLNFIQGNVLKYVTRFRKKNGAEDLKKAIHYCKLSGNYEGIDFSSCTFDVTDALKFIEVNNAEFSVDFLFFLSRGDFRNCIKIIEKLF